MRRGLRRRERAGGRRASFSSDNIGTPSSVSVVSGTPHSTTSAPRRRFLVAVVKDSPISRSRRDRHVHDPTVRGRRRFAPSGTTDALDRFSVPRRPRANPAAYAPCDGRAGVTGPATFAPHDTAGAAAKNRRRAPARAVRDREHRVASPIVALVPMPSNQPRRRVSASRCTAVERRLATFTAAVVATDVRATPPRRRLPTDRRRSVRRRREVFSSVTGTASFASTNSLRRASVSCARQLAPVARRTRRRSRGVKAAFGNVVPEPRSRSRAWSRRAHRTQPRTGDRGLRCERPNVERHANANPGVFSPPGRRSTSASFSLDNVGLLRRHDRLRPPQSTIVNPRFLG